MKFAIVIHKEDGTVFGVTVPDIPGCFSAGETFDEAIQNAKDAIYAHFEVLNEEGMKIDLKQSSIDDLIANPDYQGGIWALVDIDMAKVDTKPERINISIPRFVLSKIDEHINSRHETRSGFLARAALREIEEDSSEKHAVAA